MTEIVSGTAQAVENTFSRIEVAEYRKRSDGLVQFYVCAHLTSSGLTDNTQKLFSGFPIPLQSIRFVGMLANSQKVARFRIENDGSLYNSYTETNNTQNEVIELSGFYFSKIS